MEKPAYDINIVGVGVQTRSHTNWLEITTLYQAKPLLKTF